MLELFVIFIGRVQGVGFRAKAKRAADRLQLTGYVKNLSNGAVELVAQGSREVLQRLLSELKEQFEIHEAQEEFRPPAEKYTSFQVTL